MSLSSNSAPHPRRWVSQRRGTNLKCETNFYLRVRPEYGSGCLICAEFGRQPCTHTTQIRRNTSRCLFPDSAPMFRHLCGRATTQVALVTASFVRGMRIFARGRRIYFSSHVPEESCRQTLQRVVLALSQSIWAHQFGAPGLLCLSRLTDLYRVPSVLT